MDGDIRRETEDGSEYLVVPTALARERVYDYSDQPIPNDREFLPAAELERAASSFDGVPINIEHPFVPSGESETGVAFGSIGHDDVLNPRVVGESRNPRMNGDTLVVDSWLNVDDATMAENPQYAAAIRDLEARGEPIPVSPGYDLGSTSADTAGFDVRADAVQRDLSGDHVAVTLTSNPRCSVSEGCAIGGEVLDQLARASAGMDTRPALASETFRLNDSIMDDATEERTNASYDDLRTGDTVRWNSSGGTAYGKIRKLIKSEDAQFDDEIDGDQTVTGPAALIEVYRPGDDGWEQDDTMVAHKPGTLTVIDGFPDRSNASVEIDEEGLGKSIANYLASLARTNGQTTDEDDTTTMDDETDDERVDELVEFGLDRENVEPLAETDCIGQIYQWAESARANAEDPEEDEGADTPEEAPEVGDDPKGAPDEDTEESEPVDEMDEERFETITDQLSQLQEEQLTEDDVVGIVSEYTSEQEAEARRSELTERAVANSEWSEDALPKDIDRLETFVEQLDTESEEASTDAPGTDFGAMRTDEQRLNAVDDEDEIDLSLAKDTVWEDEE